MMPVAVFSSFIHSHLQRSTSFELNRVTLLITFYTAEWQPHWGILKEAVKPLWEATYDPVLESSLPENPPSSRRREKKLLCLYLSWYLCKHCPYLYFWWYPHLCLRFVKYSIISPWDGYCSSKKSKSSNENVSASPFFSFISLSGSRVCSLYLEVIKESLSDILFYLSDLLFIFHVNEVNTYPDSFWNEAVLYENCRKFSVPSPFVMYAIGPFRSSSLYFTKRRFSA